MAVHPLPALLFKDQDKERFGSPSKEHDLVRPERERTSIREGNEDHLTLFDDKSEIDTRMLQHAETLYGDSEVPPQRSSESAVYDTQTHDASTTPFQRSDDDSTASGVSDALNEQDDFSWVSGDDAILTGPFRRASFSVVYDYIPETTATQEYNHNGCNMDKSPSHAPTHEDDEPHHKLLVRFANTPTILCTPLPNPPPHHISSSSASSLVDPPLCFNRDAYKRVRLKPCGPRIPPWVSTENLDRKRRLRTDFRTLGDTLEERFEADSKRRSRQRMRREEAIRKGFRRTEAEELRELVLGIYPEIEDDRGGRRGCCLCMVM